MYRHGQAQRALAAVARQLELLRVAVGEREQHRAGHCLRVAFAEPRRREFGALARELLGFGVRAQFDRGQRAVRERGCEFARLVADTRAQRRQHAVEIGTCLLRPPAQAVYLRAQHQAT